jgi:hypothetical protein
MCNIQCHLSKASKISVKFVLFKIFLSLLFILSAINRDFTVQSATVIILFLLLTA